MDDSGKDDTTCYQGTAGDGKKTEPKNQCTAHQSLSPPFFSGATEEEISLFPLA
jgi:hypothetical protein